MEVNLGCGRFPKPGFVNVDREKMPGVDVVHNLDSKPYPFKDNEVSRIEADHVLEHLSDPIAVMKEIHRVLKPGGKVVIRVPHFTRGFTHPEHQRGFSSTFPFYFNPDFKGGYMGVHFIHVSTKMNWLAQMYLLKTLYPWPITMGLSILNFVFSGLANVSPHVCSKLWCFWVGGFDEIVFEFQKPTYDTH